MITSEMAEAIVEGGRRARSGRGGLTVLYDDRCALCRRLRDWLAARATLVPVEFVAADSREAHSRFPALDHRRTTRILTVVGGDGAVYEAERAWLACGWLLPEWQPVTERLGAGRLRLRLAAVGARAIDGYRHRRLAVATGGCESCGRR